MLCFERDLLENILSQERVVLSQREGQVVSLVAQGLMNKEIPPRCVVIVAPFNYLGSP